MTLSPVGASKQSAWRHAAYASLTKNPSFCTQCALLANSAGVGGGPFYVPLLNVVVGFSLQECTGLSHTIVATSAIASTLYGLTHPRPSHPDRPLVDLDVALIFIPALLFGVSLGESLAKMCFRFIHIVQACSYLHWLKCKSTSALSKLSVQQMLCVAHHTMAGPMLKGAALVHLCSYRMEITCVVQ